jgi:hypothetical protein
VQQRAACDRYQYKQLGQNGYLENCTDNRTAALAAFGMTPPETPSPLNLFMNISWSGPGNLSFDPPISTPGSFVVMRAEMDLVIVFSTCPQDNLLINGTGRSPTEAHFELIG